MMNNYNDFKQPFSDFLDIATIGILPKHVYGKYGADALLKLKKTLKLVLDHIKLKMLKPKKVCLKHNS